MRKAFHQAIRKRKKEPKLMGESLIVIVYCLLCCCTHIVEQTIIILIIIISTRLDLVDAAIFIPLHSAVCCRVRRSVKLIDEE